MVWKYFEEIQTITMGTEGWWRGGGVRAGVVLVPWPFFTFSGDGLD